MSYMVSAGVLVYVIWKLNPGQLASSLGGVRWWILLIAVGLGVVSIALQSFRWWFLLREDRVRYRYVVQATYLGSLLNQLLPLRSGEVIRGMVVSRRSGRPLAGVLSTEVVERVADGVAMAALVLVAVRDLALPGGLRAAALMLGIGVGLLVGALALMAWRERALTRRITSWNPSGRLRVRARRILLDLMLGLRSIRDWRSVVVALGTAIVMAGLQVAIIFLALRAFQIQLGYVEAAAVLAVISLGTLLPSTPGNVGGWQFFCVLGLGAFGVSQGLAAGFSLVAYSVLSLGSLLGGVVALATSPFSFAELRGFSSQKAATAGKKASSSRGVPSFTDAAPLHVPLELGVKISFVNSIGVGDSAKAAGSRALVGTSPPVTSGCHAAHRA